MIKQKRVSVRYAVNLQTEVKLVDPLPHIKLRAFALSSSSTNMFRRTTMKQRRKAYNSSALSRLSANRSRELRFESFEISLSESLNTSW